MIYRYISWHFVIKIKITSFWLRKRAITTLLSRKFIITRLSIAFEDLLGSSIAPQVMPHWLISFHLRLACQGSWRLSEKRCAYSFFFSSFFSITLKNGQSWLGPLVPQTGIYLAARAAKNNTDTDLLSNDSVSVCHRRDISSFLENLIVQTM